MGTAKRSVRFAALLASVAWVVSLAGFYEIEHAGLHTIEDSRKLVFSESDAGCDSDHKVSPVSDKPDHPTDSKVSLLDGSPIPPLPAVAALRSGISRLPMTVTQRIATSVLRT